MAEKHDRSIYDAPAFAGVLCGFNFQGGSMLGLSRKETDNELTTAMAKGRMLDSNLLQDLAVEDLYDEQILPEKKRRLTPGQEEIAYYSRRPCLHFKVCILERSFEEGKKLLPERKSELARKLGLHPRQIAIWFQNRKARWKTKQLERDFHQLKSSYDKLLSDHNSLRALHDSILNHNQQLLHQVASLNERLKEKEWIRDDKWTDGVIETTTTAHEAKLAKAAEIEANVSCTIISQGIVMKAPPKSSVLEDSVHLDGKDDGTVHNIDVVSIKEDGELGLMASTTKLESGGELPYYLEIEAGAESHHNYMIFSEDQQGINGVCFSDDMIYTTGEESGAFVVEHHQPLIREDEGAGMSWWIWH